MLVFYTEIVSPRPKEDHPLSDAPDNLSSVFAAALYSKSQNVPRSGDKGVPSNMAETQYFRTDLKAMRTFIKLTEMAECWI
jgi:hypothetical protein